MVSVYQQLQDKVKQLDNADEQILRLKSEKRDADSAIWQLKEVERCLNVILKQKPGEGRAETDAAANNRDAEAALEDFREALKFVEEKGYDKNVIKRLLYANTFIASKGVASFYVSKCQALLSQQEPLKLELYNRLFEGSIDNFLQHIDVGQSTVHVEGRYFYYCTIQVKFLF